MDTPHETSLLAKALWSAGIVMGLAFVAERIGTRIAGLLAGAPLSAVLIFFFVGRDMGIAYIVDSVPHGIASFSGTLVFVLVYYWTSSRLARFPALGGAMAAIAAYLGIASVLATIPFTLASGTALTVFVIALSHWLLRKIDFAALVRPISYTAHLLLLRGGVAAALIITVIMLAEILGPRWTGLLVGFPTTLLPTLLIIHFTHGTAATHAMIRNFPIGMGSIILYILSVPHSFTLWGVYGGTAASLAVAFTYLSVIMFFGQRWLSPTAQPGGGQHEAAEELGNADQHRE
jgi:uncharacterized membrane protein (GlpM family)|tara:strand:- start:28 stop:897 length:870 start_codon:yes stop_codon:yes gene_type:complete